MTIKQAREIFDRVASVHRQNGNLDQAAKIELAREYFTNTKFCEALKEYTRRKIQ